MNELKPHFIQLAFAFCPFLQRRDGHPNCAQNGFGLAANWCKTFHNLSKSGMLS